MNILQINKFFYIHGGVERYFFKLAKLLELQSHKIAFFSMRDSKNFSSKWSKYFVDNISYEKIEFKNCLEKLFHLFYSIEARNKISKLLDKFKPDVTHLHSIYHHLSPSIILELKKRKIPIVQTVHDYHLVAPNYNLFHNGLICEITNPNRFYKAIFHRCVKNSYIASTAEVMEKYLHYWFGWERSFVDHFISPSKFMKKKLIKYGISRRKIINLPYFINFRNYTPNYNDAGYILYFGRLSEEKGLTFLIDAIKGLPKVRLKIVGRGPLKSKLDRKIRDKKIRNIEIMGFKDGRDLKNLIASSRFTILSSIWYENFPNSILESFASGKPVIASNIGGIPELVKDDFNGFLFEPGNIDDCREKIIKLWSTSLLCRKLGKNAWDYVEKNFGLDEHYERLMEIYKRAIVRHR